MGFYPSGHDYRRLGKTFAVSYMNFHHSVLLQFASPSRTRCDLSIRRRKQSLSLKMIPHLHSPGFLVPVRVLGDTFPSQLFFATKTLDFSDWGYRSFSETTASLHALRHANYPLVAKTANIFGIHTTLFLCRKLSPHKRKNLYWYHTGVSEELLRHLQPPLQPLTLTCGTTPTETQRFYTPPVQHLSMHCVSNDLLVFSTTSRSPDNYFAALQSPWTLA